MSGIATHDLLAIERPDLVGAVTETIDAADLVSRPYVPPSYLVEHLVPERSSVLLSADTGAGKTSFLIHLAASYCLGFPVGRRFGTSWNGRPVLYLNGEMTEDQLRNYVHANMAGCGIDVGAFPRDRLHFDGRQGMSPFSLSANDASAARALEERIDRLRPSIVIFDTFRALFEADESKAQDVRRVLTWLATLRTRYDLSIVTAHHVRKLSPISNGARERVSGSRDLIAAVDVHLAMRSTGGRPVNALLLDKTRSRLAGIAAGAEWPIEARWIDGDRPCSTFIAGEPTDNAESSSAVETAAQEILDQLAAEPSTKDQLKVRGGARQRAFTKLVHDKQVGEIGKVGRKTLYAVLAPGQVEVEA